MEAKPRDFQTTDAEERFAEEIRGAAEATGHLIEEKAEELARASEQISAAFKAAGDLAQVTYESAREQVVAGAQAADKVIRRHPYEAVGVALGVGFLVGFLLKRK